MPTHAARNGDALLDVLRIPSVNGREQFIVLGPAFKFCHNSGGFHQAREHHADGNRLALASDPHQLARRLAGQLSSGKAGQVQLMRSRLCAVQGTRRKEVARRNIEGSRDGCQARGRHPVGPLLVLLQLLMGDSD
jgi:hypothetical protein